MDGIPDEWQINTPVEDVLIDVEWQGMVDAGNSQ
jgi:hypothetical protein